MSYENVCMNCHERTRTVTKTDNGENKIRDCHSTCEKYLEFKRENIKKGGYLLREVYSVGADIKRSNSYKRAKKKKIVRKKQGR